MNTNPPARKGATGRRPSKPSKPVVLPAASLCMRDVNQSEGEQAAQKFKTIGDVLGASIAREQARKANG